MQRGYIPSALNFKTYIMKSMLLILKTQLISLLIVLLLFLLGKLFIIPPKNLCWASENVKQSKRVNAYVGECRIFKVDTLMPGYKFPVEKIWVEKLYRLGRNCIGIVTYVTIDKKRIIVDIIPDDPFFNHDSFSKDKWVIKDSLTHGIGHSSSRSGSDPVIDLDYHYQQGDTAIFKIFKLDKKESNVWRDETMDLMFKIYTVCDWEEK